MTATRSASEIVKSISDFNQLLEVCKAHNVTSLKLGDIEFVLQDKHKIEYTRDEPLDINKIAHETYSSL